MTKRLLPVFAIFFLSLFCNLAYALPFTIIPKAGTTLPTTVSSGASVAAYYTVTNNTHETRKQNFVKYLPANVTQVTTGGTYGDTCGTTFNLAANGQAGSSCTLQLTITGAVPVNQQDSEFNLFVCFPGGTTCTGTFQSLHVTQISTKPPVLLSTIAVTPTSSNISINGTQQYTATGNYSDGSTTNLTATVTWASSNTAKATISAAGLATGVAVGTTNITAAFAGITSNTALLSVANPVISIAITPTPAAMPAGGSQQFTAIATFADTSTQNVTTLATWGSSSTGVATIGLNTGLATGVALGSTTITAMYSGISQTSPLSVTTFIYVTTNQSQSLYCALNSDGSVGTCTQTGGTTPVATYGVATNSAGTALYVGDNNGAKIYYCPVQANGSLGTCVNTGAATFVPNLIALNPAGSILYAATTTAIRVCNVSGSTLSGCALTGSGLSAGNLGVAINSANTFAYVSNLLNGTVYMCPITAGGASTSTLGACTSQASGFTSTQGITINPAGTLLYISDTGNNRIAYCPINGNGTLGTCLTANTSSLLNPTYIAINATTTLAYVTGGSGSSSILYTCPINSDGTLATCTSVIPGFINNTFRAIAF